MAYACLLTWLLAQGVDLSADEPSARITPDRVRAYVVFLREGRSSVTVASYLGVLCMAVLAMFPNRDWRWLQAFQAQAHRHASPARQKRNRLVPAGQLRQLGLDLIQRAGDVLDRARESEAGLREITAAARDYRDGLIIAFLASRPLRVKNLLQIEIGIHLRQSGSRTTLHFRSSETKERCVRDTIWPEVLEPALARYITQIRPMLIAARAPGHQGTRARRSVSAPTGCQSLGGPGGTPMTPGDCRKSLRAIPNGGSVTPSTIPSFDRVDLTCIRPAKGIGLTWVELKPCQGLANAMAEKPGAKPHRRQL